MTDAAAVGTAREDLKLQSHNVFWMPAICVMAQAVICALQAPRSGRVGAPPECLLVLLLPGRNGHPVCKPPQLTRISSFKGIWRKQPRFGASLFIHTQSCICSRRFVLEQMHVHLCETTARLSEATTNYSCNCWAAWLVNTRSSNHLSAAQDV